MALNNYIAKAQIDIKAGIDKVWNALIDPEMVRKYMFGTTLKSDWKVGGKITWTGEWEGKPYEDSGTVLEFNPMTMMKYDHYSPLSGQPNNPDSNPTVTIELSDEGNRTMLFLSQNHNRTEDARKHSEKNWMMILEKMKELLEENN